MRFNIVETKVPKPANYEVGMYFKNVDMEGNVVDIYILTKFMVNDKIYFIACDINLGKFWRNPKLSSNNAVEGLLPISNEDIEVIVKLKTQV